MEALRETLRVMGDKEKTEVCGTKTFRSHIGHQSLVTTGRCNQKQAKGEGSRWRLIYYQGIQAK
jgi:hypothetical protein